MVSKIFRLAKATNEGITHNYIYYYLYVLNEKMDIGVSRNNTVINNIRVILCHISLSRSRNDEEVLTPKNITSIEKNANYALTYK